MANFTDKVAVVTGAGRGIGNAIARRFVDGGARVAVVSRTAENAAKAAEELNAIRDGVAKDYAVDVSDLEAVLAAGKEIVGDFGKVDILVNNAGGAPEIVTS